MSCLEATWIGYRSSQDRICHRTFVPKKFAEQVAQICPMITFSDGTHLRITISDARPSKNKKVIHNYDDLINRCVRYKVSSVEALCKKEEEEEIQRAFDPNCPEYILERVVERVIPKEKPECMEIVK